MQVCKAKAAGKPPAAEHWIIHGDNCEALAGMPAGSVDMVVTSPPYDDLRRYGGHGWDFYGVAWLLKRVLRPGGVIVWIVADAVIDGSESGSSMRQALHFRELGLNLHDTMVWEKPCSSFPEKTRYFQAWEYMFVLSKGKPRLFYPQLKPNKTAGEHSGPTYKRDEQGRSVISTIKPPGTKRRPFGVRLNRWYCNPAHSDRSEHPAPMPVELARDLIATWTNPGDLVLDPFAGSGSTAVAAIELGRRAISIEVNGEYVRAMSERVGRAQQIRGLGKARAAA